MNYNCIFKPQSYTRRRHNQIPIRIHVKNIEIGGDALTIFAGPCAIESEAQLFEIAKSVKEYGATILRGGAFKPRTSPDEFQGLGVEGLKLLRKVGDAFDIPVVTEILDPRDVELVNTYTDIFQIGTRNMQNFSLLTEIGRTNKPVILKRGMSATIREWICATRYITKGGNNQIIMCERGIRTFEDATRYTLALDAVPLLKSQIEFPIIVDPSHATGHASLVPAMSKASLACGADGLMIDVHCDPKNALCDGPQALIPSEFKTLMIELTTIANAMGRSIAHNIQK